MAKHKKEIEAGDVPEIPVEVAEVAAPDVAVEVAPRVPVRAEVTFSDGTVKVFSGESQDSPLDLGGIK